MYILLKLVHFEPKWEKMQQYDKSLTEVRKQMDVRLIFKKILFTERLAHVLLTPSQVTALHLQDKITISQAEEIRQNYFLSQLMLHSIEDRNTMRKSPLLANRLRKEIN